LFNIFYQGYYYLFYFYFLESIRYLPSQGIFADYFGLGFYCISGSLVGNYSIISIVPSFNNFISPKVSLLYTIFSLSIFIYSFSSKPPYLFLSISIASNVEIFEK